MKNKKFNKLIAAMLAGTMVFGMGTTAFAADGDPAGTGNTTGAGAFEGHVDKDVLSVQLPTTPAATTFAYTMDPEGLIAATEGARIRLLPLKKEQQFISCLQKKLIRRTAQN